MKEKNTNQNDIDSFIMNCRLNTNFKHGNNYFNSVKLYFNDVIDTDVIKNAIDCNFNFFIGRCHVDSKLLYLFIYKTKSYEFN